MFISSRISFTLANASDSVTIKNGYIGVLEDKWSKDSYLELLIKDGNVTVVTTKSDTKTESQIEADNKKALAKQAATERSSSITAIAGPKIEAAKQDIIAKGLPKVDQDKQIKEAVAAIMAETGESYDKDNAL